MKIDKIKLNNKKVLIFIKEITQSMEKIKVSYFDIKNG